MNSISLFISPCPNDTFMFDAWINKREEHFSGNPVHAEFFDIKTLNQLASEGVADVIKLSVFSAAHLLHLYQILQSGAALGFANGPLIVSKRKIYPDEVPFVTLAVPGFSTTAFALLKMFFSPQPQCKEYFFDEIEEVVLSNEADAGLIIHETRFTYQKKGLQLVADLGKLWEERYHLPLPLGVIAVKRNLPEEIKLTINALLKKSIEHSMQKFPIEINDFVLKHAQVKDIQVVKSHIELYVNQFSIELGEIGRRAILTFFEEMKKLHLINQSTLFDSVFVKSYEE